MSRSINFYRNVDQIILWYHCPEKNFHFLENVEVRFIFGNDLFVEREKILLRLSNNLKYLFNHSTRCDKCNFPYSYCIKLFDCYCSDKICFACMNKENFDLNNAFSKCNKCLNIHYNYDVYIMFKCLTLSAILCNGLEESASQIDKTFRLLKHKLDYKQIEVKEVPSEIDFTDEIPKKESKKSKCCPLIFIIIIVFFFFGCVGLLILEYLRQFGRILK